MAATGSGQFVWYDLMSRDTDASKTFYTTVFGWGTRADRPLLGEDGRPPYTMWMARDTPIAGLVPLNEDKPPGDSGAAWCYYVRVEDVGAATDKVRQNGGQIVHGPVEVPGGDVIAQCRDPLGGMFALRQFVFLAACGTER